MLLRLVTEPSHEGATLGSLYVDGVWQCWTLEDQLREVPGQPVSTWKVAKETAIPRGLYPVTITLSQRFGRLLPLLVGVHGFSGIRIHPGNAIHDTEGCILVGRRRGRYKGAPAVLESRLAFDNLFEILADAVQRQDPVRILLEPPMLTVAA